MCLSKKFEQICQAHLRDKQQKKSSWEEQKKSSRQTSIDWEGISERHIWDISEVNYGNASRRLKHFRIVNDLAETNEKYLMRKRIFPFVTSSNDYCYFLVKYYKSSGSAISFVGPLWCWGEFENCGDFQCEMLRWALLLWNVSKFLLKCWRNFRFYYEIQNLFNVSMLDIKFISFVKPHIGQSELAKTKF